MIIAPVASNGLRNTRYIPPKRVTLTANAPATEPAIVTSCLSTILRLLQIVVKVVYIQLIQPSISQILD